MLHYSDAKATIVEESVTRFGLHKCISDICIYSRKEILFFVIFINEFLAHWSRSSTCQSAIGKSKSQKKVWRPLRACYTMYIFV